LILNITQTLCLSLLQDTEFASSSHGDDVSNSSGKLLR